MTPARLVLIIAVTLIVAPRVDAQPAPVSPELRNAQALSQAQKWPEAVVAFEGVVKTDPADPRGQAGLAAALYATGDLARAMTHAMEAARILEDPKAQFAVPGLSPGLVMARIARIHNRQGHVDDAFTWLNKAANYPLPNMPALETEPDIANLRADPRWKTFTATVKSNVDPCNSLPEYRQFDFWVGDWDVKGGAGQLVGTSRVERILNNCVIQETYTAAPGASAAQKYVGQAFHFYDQNAKKWMQHYIDTTAAPFDWVGEVRDGAMQYTREGPFGPSNLFVKQRMTFTPQDGGVRQVFEQSIDGGKTWRSGFVGSYVKRAAGSGEKHP